MNSIAGAGRRRGWYHGWNIVAVAILSQVAANGLPVNSLSLFLHDWSAELHSPMSTFQLGLAALGVGSAFLSPLIGILADKYPARWLFVAGLVGLAIFHLGVSFATATWQVLACFIVFLPISVVLATTLTANAVVSRWFVRRLGLALGLTAFGLGMAGVILPPIIAAVMPVVGWRGIWRFAGLFIAIVIIPAVILVVRDRPTERDGLQYLTGAAEGSVHAHHRSSSGGELGWRDVLKRRTFWILVVAYLPMLAVYGGCAQNLAPIAASRNLSTQSAGILLSMLSTAQLASTLTMGMLSDRFGNRLPLFGIAVATGIGGLVVAFGQGFASLGVGVMLVGLSYGLWPLVAAAIANEFGASNVGRAFGLLTMFVPLIALSPFTIAKFHEATGSYTPGLSVLATLAILGGLACLAMREHRGSGTHSAGKGPEEPVLPIG